MSVLSSVISLVDNYSKTADDVAQSAEKMGSSIGETTEKIKKQDSALKQATSKYKPVKIEAQGIDGVSKQVRTLETDIRKLTGKDYDIRIREKRTIKERIHGIKDAVIDKPFQKIRKFRLDLSDYRKAQKEAKRHAKELERLTGRKHKIQIEMPSGLKSQLNGILGGIKGAVGKVGGGLKKVALGIGKGLMVGGGMALTGAAAAATKMISSGAELEQQKISMTHFLGGDEKKSEAYMKALRKEANATPFETAEVVQAGTRAIQIAEGDTTKGMQLVKMAEDMAALTPGKSISDAMEALADMQMGEMERMKEFGFKSSKEEFDKAGGDITKMKSSSGMTMDQIFKGGAEKLAKSTGGKWSTVKGNLGSGIQDAGMKILDKLAPALEKLIPVSEKIAEMIPGKVEAALNLLSPLVKPAGEMLRSLGSAVSPILPALGSLAKSAIPFLSGAMKIVSGVLSSVAAPAFRVIGSILSKFVAPVFEFLGGILSDYVSPALDKVGKWTNKLADLFESLIGSISDFFGELFGGISGFFGDVKESVSSFFSSKDDTFAYKGTDPTMGWNASGTEYWKGGLTHINELGQEVVDLPKGTRIYPAGASERMIQEMVNDVDSDSNFSKEKVSLPMQILFPDFIQSQISDRGPLSSAMDKHSENHSEKNEYHFHITINDASNVDESMLAKLIHKQFKEAAFNMA